LESIKQIVVSYLLFAHIGKHENDSFFAYYKFMTCCIFLRWNTCTI